MAQLTCRLLCPSLLLLCFAAATSSLVLPNPVPAPVAQPALAAVYQPSRSTEYRPSRLRPMDAGTARAAPSSR